MTTQNLKDFLPKLCAIVVENVLMSTSLVTQKFYQIQQKMNMITLLLI